MFNAHTTGIIKSLRVSLRTSGINTVVSIPKSTVSTPIENIACR